MAFTVQNDTGSQAGANAYISVAEFKAYHDNRGNDYSGAADDTAIEYAIIKATDYIDQRFNFVGKKMLGRDQTTEWPRSNAWDKDRYYITDIPIELKDACAEYALRAISAVLNPDPTRDDSGQAVQSKSETVGPISESVTFTDGAVFRMPKYPAADQKLIKSGLVRRGGDLRRG